MFSRVYVAALACLALATLSAAIVVPPGKCLDLSDPVATCETDVCSMQGTTCKKSCVQDRCSDCASKCACDTDADCDETEWCRNTLIPQHVGTCVRLAQEGEPCEGRRFGSYPNRCASGLVCTHASNMRRDMPGVCTAPAATAAVAAAVAAPAEADLCAFSEEAKKPCLSMIAIQRFYYNAAAGDCLAYTTCRLTNFGSYDECKQSCAAKSAAPAPVAAPEAALVAEVAAPQPTCAFDTSAKEPCLSAIVIKRWFYSSEAGDCVAYTTCRMTNFDSYEQCKASCAAADVPSTPTTPELCASAPDMSKPCLDEIVLKRWYFSSAAGKCVSYTTCRNEFFASETECSASCSSFAPAPIADVVAAPAMEKCAFDVAANQRCLSMIRMKRYYYSAEAGQCVAYVTCRATNFSSMQECNQSCAATTASA